MSTWANHGTKILGFVVALIGALGDVQQLFVAVDANPKHIALYSLIVALGGAVIKRGFGNSSSTPPPAAPILLAFLLTVPLMAQLVACTTLSFQEQLAAAYGTYTTVERAADQAFMSGTLPRVQAESAREMAKKVRPFLDGAKAASTAGDQSTAQADLTLATTALTALQTYVNAQVAKGAK